MSKTLILAAGLGLTLVAGCTQNIRPTDADRAILGAAGLATAAHVAGKKESDVYKAAALGGVGGALCDDVRLCQ